MRIYVIIAMRKVLVLCLLICLLMPNILASVNKEDIEKSYGINTGDILKSSYKEIEIELTKEGISYREITNLFISKGEGYLLFLLPEGKDYDKLDLYDLKTPNKERLIELEDITKIDNCEGYYTVKKTNDTWSILVCPNIVYNEVQIEIDSLLYNDNSGCSVGCYKMIFPEINAGIKEYITEDFRVVFRLLLDDTFYLGEDGEGTNFKGNCSSLNLTEHKLYNGIICEGKPDISIGIIFTNLSITAKDKNWVQYEKERKDRKLDLGITLILGIVIVFFITLFSKILADFGEKIYARDKLWKKILFWGCLLIVLSCIIALLIIFI